MTDFLIKSTLSLAAFLGFYHLFLEREKMHAFNRFYLLFSIAISLSIPFITFEIIQEIPVVATPNPNFVIIPNQIPATPLVQVNYTPYIIGSIYTLITLILAVRFGKNIWKLVAKSHKNPSIKLQNAQLVLVEEKILPHTFLNSIFINYEDYNSRNIEEELYTHELVHVTQKHTIDILFIELLKTVFWFNPLFLFYKKAIQLNHEFLADEKVVESYNNVPFYQSLLLQKGNGTATIYLASNLNYLVTKKRLIMMTKNTSLKIAVLKKIAIVPILAILVFFLCIKTVAQEKNSKVQNSNLVSNSKIQKTTLDSVKKNKTEKQEIQINNKKQETNNNEKPKSGYITINNETCFYVTNDDGTTEYYSRWGFRINEKGERLDPTKQQKQSPGTFTINGETFFYAYNEDGTKEYYNRLGFKVDENGKRINSQNPNVEIATATKNPEFPGGLAKLYEFIAKNYNIPEEATKNHISGNILLSFIIEEDGSLSEIKVLKDLKFGTGEEAIRVLKNSPKWTPGEIDGKKTRMQQSLPIKIQS